MRLVSLATVILLLNAPHIAMPQAAQRVTLQQLRDSCRPLLIFSPSAHDARLKRQIELLEVNVAGSRERNIVLVPVPGFPDALHSIPTYALTDEGAARARFHVADSEFVVILIGKDGGEKLRATTPLAFEKLRETIDAMPMRQDEMRRAKP